VRHAFASSGVLASLEQGRGSQGQHETTQQGGIANKAKYNRVEKLSWNLQAGRYGFEKGRCPDAEQQEALTTDP